MNKNVFYSCSWTCNDFGCCFSQITKTDGYTMLKSSSSDYLAVYGAKIGLCSGKNI